MSAHDIIEIPGRPGMWARRAIVDAWQAAGSPPLNDAGRLYAKQKDAWDAYQAGTGSPADNPDRPDLYPLAHVRFVALDITPTPDRVRRLTAAGLVRPYKYEPWHWELPNVRQYPLVHALPTTSEENDDMTFTDLDRALLERAASKPDRNDIAVIETGGTYWIVDHGDGTKWNAARGQESPDQAMEYIKWLRDGLGIVQHLNQAPFVLAGYRDITNQK